MTIDKVKELKHELEQKLAGYVYHFEKETGTVITDVRMFKTEERTKVGPIKGINFEITVELCPTP